MVFLTRSFESSFFIISLPPLLCVDVLVGILNGAANGPIDLRRDGKMEYRGALDDVGHRTQVANHAVDGLVRKLQYTKKRFQDVKDMPLRLWWVAYSLPFRCKGR